MSRFHDLRDARGLLARVSREVLATGASRDKLVIFELKIASMMRPIHRMSLSDNDARRNESAANAPF
jgi:hypothetical protein